MWQKAVVSGNKKLHRKAFSRVLTTRLVQLLLSSVSKITVSGRIILFAACEFHCISYS